MGLLDALIDFYRDDRTSPTITIGGGDSPAVASDADPLLETLNAVFDEIVAICPNDWADRQIRKVQGAIAVRWPSIRSSIVEQLKTVPDHAHAIIDLALKSLSTATVGRPLIHAAVNIVRGMIDALWDDVFPKAAVKLAAKGITLTDAA